MAPKEEKNIIAGSYFQGCGSASFESSFSLQCGSGSCSSSKGFKLDPTGKQNFQGLYF
jgi:hypothetical protein